MYRRLCVDCSKGPSLPRVSVLCFVKQTSLSKLDSNPSPTAASQARPDYVELVRLLIGPLVASPNEIHIDCEVSRQGRSHWLRLALPEEEQGRLLGRGGRNLQAIRSVLEAAAQLAEQRVTLDIYSPQGQRKGPPGPIKINR
jgi:uncharacterized protein